ncbi:MAG: hypothetical protein IIX96_03215 [Clostridia bacterium]|nr:hypothetical protein [Clostridia bacterium]
MNKKLQIAYRCPDCTDATLGFVGKFTTAYDMVRLKCSCGKSALEMRKKDGKVSISAPCILCKSDHSFTVSEGALFGGQSFNLPCPYSSIDTVFIGDADYIQKELDRTAEQLSQIVSGFEAEDVHELQPIPMNDDEILPDPAVYDTIRFLLKDLEGEGLVSCPCDNGKYDLRFIDGGIQAYCEHCGATYDFYATSPSLAEEYLSMSEIKLK